MCTWFQTFVNGHGNLDSSVQLILGWDVLKGVMNVLILFPQSSLKYQLLHVGNFGNKNYKNNIILILGNINDFCKLF